MSSAADGPCSAAADAVLSAAQDGDRVIYSKYAGTDVQVAGDEHVLLKVRAAWLVC